MVKTLQPVTIPTERIILLSLIVAGIACLIFYVLFLMGKEFMRRFNLWVIQRARRLEEQQQHHQHHRKTSPRPKGGASVARRPGKPKKKDDSYSGGEDSSSDNSNSYSD